jgi:hypothetical protein
MQKWEYKTLLFSRVLEPGALGGGYSPGQWSSTGDLNSLGNDGWELVGMAPVAAFDKDSAGWTNQVQFVFKRPK